ncbi:MAG TPA: hypothetical protein VFW38_11870 [Solirubrobacteraceae bacterium]|nr:hypothetical protein [Solirubrobacteraceae bacterium]
MDRPPSADGDPFLVEQTTSNGLTVTIKAYRPRASDAEQIRQQQLAVAVKLLKRAAAERRATRSSEPED